MLPFGLNCFVEALHFLKGSDMSMEDFSITVRSENPAKEARKAVNRFSRVVTKCQRELELMKKSLQGLEGESTTAKDLTEFERNLESMLEFVDETMRHMGERLLSSTMVNGDKLKKKEGGQG